ncbi:MAG: hypothetical protein R6U32_04400 [Candidatus Woesearchaeota archaeon]
MMQSTGISREMMGKSAVFAVSLLVLACITACTSTEVVDLNMTSNNTVNTTKFTPSNTSSDRTGEGTNRTGEKSIPVADDREIIEGLCTEKVLLAIRGCRWSSDSDNLEISIKNNGFRNVTMAFYFYADGRQVGSMFSENIFTPKEEKTYNLPMKDLQEQYGSIKKIHATPILDEGGKITSCSNKKLPILVQGCS